MKKPINNLDDIIYYVAKENGVSEDLVRNVYDKLWEGVRYFLSRPLECGRKLMLEGFIKFEISEPKTHNYVKKLRNKEGNIPERKNDIEFYEKLFELAAGETFDKRYEKIQNGKRQTKEKS